MAPFFALAEQLQSLQGRGFNKTIKISRNSELWQGKVDEVINSFIDFKGQAFKTFCNYLETHRCRIVNYQYYKEESISSIGSGTEVLNDRKRLQKLADKCITIEL